MKLYNIHTILESAVEQKLSKFQSCVKNELSRVIFQQNKMIWKSYISKEIESNKHLD